MSSTTGAPTLSGSVHDRLRVDILRGTLRPGERLRLMALSERYVASQSVVREALARLAEQGLVVTVAQQGYRVRPLSETDLLELTDARVALESMVLRLAVTRGTLDWESSVVAAHHRLAGTSKIDPDGAPSQQWFVAHEHFHRSLLDGCRNERLVDAAVTLRDAATLYRWWSAPHGYAQGRDIDAEHRELLESVLARDADAAVEAIAQHLRRTTNLLRPDHCVSPAPGRGNRTPEDSR